jgi:hypothetical protein
MDSSHRALSPHSSRELLTNLKSYQEALPGSSVDWTILNAYARKLDTPMVSRTKLQSAALRRSINTDLVYGRRSKLNKTVLSSENIVKKTI